jgi:hypothetical protein
MSNKPTPKFMKPGDDPELDRLLEKARREGSEPPGEYYYDLFGRRRRLAVVDQDAPTIPGSPWAGKGVEIDKAALPSALMPTKAPVVSTRPVVTEMPAGVPPKNQMRWLALGALAIVGAVVSLALGAIQPPKVQPGTMIAPPAAVSAAAMASPPVVSAAAAPTMTAVPVIEMDAGAAPAVTSAPSSTTTAPVRPRDKVAPRGPTPTSPEDPYSNPPATPRKPDAGSKIW